MRLRCGTSMKAIKNSYSCYFHYNGIVVPNFLLLPQFTFYLMETKLVIALGTITLLIGGLLFVTGQVMQGSKFLNPVIRQLIHLWYLPESESN